MEKQSTKGKCTSPYIVNLIDLLNLKRAHTQLREKIKQQGSRSPTIIQLSPFLSPLTITVSYCCFFPPFENKPKDYPQLYTNDGAIESHDEVWQNESTDMLWILVCL